MSFGVISSRSSVSVGAHVLIGGNARVFDHDFHALPWQLRRSGHTDAPNVRTAPIVIEDDVWIGAGALVLKGVRIGRGAILAAHAVVANDVPEAEIWGGNPARRIREVPSWPGV